MAVHIIADSGCDIPQIQAQMLGIQVLPLTVYFGADSYQDGIDLSGNQFYTLLQTRTEPPTTSQVTPWQFEQALQVMGPADEAVIITISGLVSGTLQSAEMAAENYGGRVRVVDSRNMSHGFGILVRYAAALAAAGHTAAEIVDAVIEVRPRAVFFGVVDTLDYLRRSGRISRTVAFAGGLLGIKPVLAAYKGQVTMVGKARGMQQGHQQINRLIQAMGGIDFDKPYAVVYAGTEDTTTAAYIRDSAEIWRPAGKNIPVYQIGSAIGTHLGPGAVGAAFIASGSLDVLGRK